MRSLLTRLTESIGDTIANHYIKNEFVTEKLHLNDKVQVNTRPPLSVELGDINMKDVLVALDKENKSLLNQLKDFIETSDFIANKYAKKNSNVKAPSSSSSCGRSSGSSCGRSSGSTRARQSSSSCGGGYGYNSRC